ncbi:2-methylaconitate cis-trans isomerase PrpF family protein [Arvimicrobium flavum]|uniref:2-methylaconitate cis-trans isomerase PrpF family protein n=1 Tax=Arvimicrobium flavum TaxID=3393320 RepID=UPI00237AD7D1|nr:PrpF domain-containing protein [Mesorhizobium shangrilense]
MLHVPAQKTANLVSDPQQVSVRALFMRGGSSRGAVFLEEDLPSDPQERAALLLACYGSPDRRQIDGIGGSDPLTSKAAVVGRSSRPDADLDYTFLQIGIDRAMVSSGGNCGNMLAAVGPFGVLRGLIEPQEPETSVRIHTTNTGQVVTARFRVAGGYPCVDGEARVPGVPGTGSSIALDFGDCAGAVSGKLLPTGSVRDLVRLGNREVSVSLVDAATPFVFVPAYALGATGAETPAEILANSTLMPELEALRGWAATVLGLVERREDAGRVSPNVPRVIMVGSPQNYDSQDGPVRADAMDVCVRQMAMQKPHNTLAVTGAVCAAVASRLQGSVVAELSQGKGERTRLGHPAGVLGVSARVATDGDGWRIERAAVERTARLLMAGELLVSRRRLDEVRGILEH